MWTEYAGPENEGTNFGSSQKVENAGPENGGTNLGSSQKVENAGPENGGPKNGGPEIAGPSTCAENAGIMSVIGLSDRNAVKSKTVHK